jgi:CrcB protein
MNFILVAIGGGIGAIIRYRIGLFFSKEKKFNGTWVVNVSGSMLLGLLWSLYQRNILSEAGWLIVGVGFCGAYTTFSTFGYETLSMIQEKKEKKALTYVFLSVFVSFVSAGIMILLFT